MMDETPAVMERETKPVGRIPRVSEGIAHEEWITQPARVAAEPSTLLHRHLPTLMDLCEACSDSHRVRWPIFGPFAAVLVLTLIIRQSSVDIAISRCFFSAQLPHWPWFYSAICTLFYRGGVYPACLLAMCGGAWSLWALVRSRTWQAAQPGVFLYVLLLLGPGLIVNLGLKHTWGRPRPNEVREFGGRHDFVPVGSLGTLQQHNSSFPSGHAAVAFYLIAPAFLVSARRPRLARGLMSAGLAFGGCMGAVRVIQGGHFASDVVWSAAIVYFTGVILARVLLREATRLRLADAAAPVQRQHHTDIRASRARAA